MNTLQACSRVWNQAEKWNHNAFLFFSWKVRDSNGEIILSKPESDRSEMIHQGKAETKWNFFENWWKCTVVYLW